MEQFFNNRLLPAVTIDDVDSAKRLAEAYLEAGLDILEFTFRTEATLASIEAVAESFPELTVGAGTILSPEQVPLARDAGARFGLSPGFNEKVVEAARNVQFPFIPGVMTPSEIEKALENGCRILKLFPAGELGGVAFIRSMEGPYAQTGLRLIPMGGVTMENMNEFLECATVIAVGGSWLAPKKLIREQKFAEISKRVRRSLDRVHGGK